MAKKQIPIQDGLFTWPSDEPQLIGQRDKRNGRIYFPAIHNYVSADESEEVLLERRGKLWTWTIQGFLPKTPPYMGPETLETFKPYGVGYVELPGQVIVETRLTESDPNKLEIGMEMELVIVKFREDEDGNDIMTFAFKPVAEAGQKAA
ncbi:MAG: OB-fold domain-containing protein [Alphaproteobacteria bacterium]|nr:OB-fold domain-containing protein [Alphaproteobacteria bacterium]